MDFRQLATMALDEYMESLRKALDGLTSKERRYQPTPDANHIDFIVWHMARVEDRWVHLFAQGTDEVWKRDGWAEKIRLPLEGSGYQYTAEQVSSFPTLSLDDLMSYYDSVRRETLAYVQSLTAEDLDKGLAYELRPGITIGKMLSHIIVEEAQHVGQVAYLRGLQRGLNK